MNNDKPYDIKINYNRKAQLVYELGSSQPVNIIPGRTEKETIYAFKYPLTSFSISRTDNYFIYQNNYYFSFTELFEDLPSFIQEIIIFNLHDFQL